MTDNRKPIRVVHEEVEEVAAPHCSEEWLAQEFAKRHKDVLRHVPQWGWVRFDGKRWSLSDRHLAAGRLTRPFLREMAAISNSGEPKTNWRTVGNIEQLAKRDNRYLYATVDQWDCDPWLLNTPDGVIDLKTGNWHDAQRADLYMTKITTVTPDNAKPRKWSEFLARITDGNAELEAFLRRICGYMLTGLTTEHALFFLYGTGANGKSVFVETIAGIMGDYATASPVTAFTHSHNERHLTEIARLRGARLVTATETEEGRRWAVAKVKQLTGGDKIAANFMRQDLFEFTPQFKLLIAGNHKPTIPSVDEAIRRRVHLIPFAVTIPPDERDHHLTGRLRKEWGAISNWMIDGCLEWQHDGLNPPAIVRKATEEYLEQEDIIQLFIAERCEEKKAEQSASSCLYAAWKEWCELRGEQPGSQKTFSQRMQGHGYSIKRLSTGNVFLGLRVNGRGA